MNNKNLNSKKKNSKNKLAKKIAKSPKNSNVVKLNTDFNSDAASLKHEIEEIDAVINKIDKILKEGE